MIHASLNEVMKERVAYIRTHEMRIVRENKEGNPRRN